MLRPKLISFICIIGYLTVVFTFPQVFSPSIKKLGIYMPAIYGILVAGNFIACVGIWYFKQWGAQIYLLSFFAKTIFFITIHQFSFGSYVATALSLFSIFVLFKYYTKMSPNL